jgi:predicted unusual protein kinase regulating ubiquinone biosynthesis (AarF/ABC1/UbiB family)
MPITGYDATAIIKYYDTRPLQVGWRLNSVGLPLLGWYFGLLADRALGVEDLETVQRKRGAELRRHLVQSGSVALIKSGQALSLRPDLIRNKIWAEELGKLVDAVGSFSDLEAMQIMKNELVDISKRIKAADLPPQSKTKKERLNKLQSLAQSDPVLRLFEFYNDNRAVASASIGQVYMAKVRRGPELEAAIGKAEAAKWGGRIVAIKVQRPDVSAAAALDMYLIRRSAMWLSNFRGGDLPSVADQFGMQLFGELDYVREANNCDRFRELYGDWENVLVPRACNSLTRKRVLVMDWVEGVKGPWTDDKGIEMVRIGLRCSVDQLMHTGLFHADPHRGNLLKTPECKLAFIDFGMMADVSEEDRYGLIGLVIGLQNKDLPLITENLLKVSRVAVG